MQKLQCYCLATVLLATPTARAEPTGGHDLDREIAWARAKWRADLKGVRFRTRLSKLLAWVPAGKSIDAYVYSPDHMCQRVELARQEDRNDPVVDGHPALVAKVNIRVWMDGGEKLREFGLLWFGDQFTEGGDWSEVERMLPNGRWRRSQAGGTGRGGEKYGVLTYADGKVARFGGEPLSAHATCGGRREWLACDSGGQRLCHRCDRLSVEVVSAETSIVTIVPADRTATCQQSCPSYSGPLLDRLHELWQRASPWRPRKIRRRSEIPALYRSRADCLRVHAHVLQDGGGAEVENDGAEPTGPRVEDPLE